MRCETLIRKFIGIHSWGVALDCELGRGCVCRLRGLGRIRVQFLQQRLPGEEQNNAGSDNYDGGTVHEKSNGLVSQGQDRGRSPPKDDSAAGGVIQVISLESPCVRALPEW